MELSSSEFLRMNDSVIAVLESQFDEVDGEAFYRFLFPDNESSGDLVTTDYDKSNAIFLSWQTADDKRPIRRIMLADLWTSDYMEYVEQSYMALCSGVSFLGRRNVSEFARKLHAIIIDLDYVGYDEIYSLFNVIGKAPSYLKGRSLPMPTFLVSSGTGLHVVYVLDKPIKLFADNKRALGKLKRSLTTMIWNPQITTKVKTKSEIQYQGIYQGYRMVGSFNAKYGVTVRAFKTGDVISIDALNSYVPDDCKVHISGESNNSKSGSVSLASFNYKWDISGKVHGKDPFALYHWWLRRVDEAVAGHRYYFMLITVIYAVKCSVPYYKLESDLKSVFDYLVKIPHNNKLTKSDMEVALSAYYKPFQFASIEKIVELTGITIEKNKRNGLTQNQHLKLARSRKQVLSEMGILKGNAHRPSCKVDIDCYLAGNPNAIVSEVADSLSISVSTVRRYYTPKKALCSSIVQFKSEHPKMSNLQIAKVLGVSRPTVIKYLRQFESSDVLVSGQNNEEKLQSGKDKLFAEVAAKLGVSVSDVEEFFKNRK